MGSKSPDHKTLASLTRLPLAGLWSRVAQHEALQRTLVANLPAPLRDHVQVACIDRDTLCVCADSAIWASELRFRSPELLLYINQSHRLDLKRCRISIGRFAPPNLAQD